MTVEHLIVLALAVAVGALFGAAALAYFKRQPLTAVEARTEAELFKLGTEALAALADTSGERQSIAAAQQRMALKAQLLAHAASTLGTVPPSLPPAAP